MEHERAGGSAGGEPTGAEEGALGLETPCFRYPYGARQGAHCCDGRRSREMCARSITSVLRTGEAAAASSRTSRVHGPNPGPTIHPAASLGFCALLYDLMPVARACSADHAPLSAVVGSAEVREHLHAWYHVRLRYSCASFRWSAAKTIETTMGTMTWTSGTHGVSQPRSGHLPDRLSRHHLSSSRTSLHCAFPRSTPSYMTAFVPSRKPISPARRLQVSVEASSVTVQHQHSMAG